MSTPTAATSMLDADGIFFLLDLTSPGYHSAHERFFSDAKYKGYLQGAPDPETDAHSVNTPSSSSTSAGVTGHSDVSSGDESEGAQPADADFDGDEGTHTLRARVPGGRSKVTFLPAEVTRPTWDPHTLSRRRLCYTAMIIVSQEDPQNPDCPELTVAELDLDSASHVSWLSGERYCRLLEHATFQKWRSGTALCVADALPRHGLIGKDSLPTTSGRPIQRIEHGDGTAVYVGISTTKFMANVGCYDMKSSSRQWENGWMDGFFAIAYAMSDTMKDDTVLGTLALSLGMSQPRFKVDDTVLTEEDAPKSFSYCLQRLIRKNIRPNAADFVAYYVCTPAHDPKDLVGRPSKTEKRSFIAFNSWPCSENLNLSEKIPVIKSAYWEPFQWVVVLKKIVVSEYDQETKEWTIRGDVVHTAGNGIPTPVHALLDCGSSVSELPLDMVKRLVELIGGKVATARDRRLYKSTKPIFTVPRRINGNKHNLGITYHFQGFTTEDVVVQTQATWFISDEEGNGLIGAREAQPLVNENGMPLPPQAGVASFGINWFNSLIVAMFDRLEDPYVRLDRQSKDNHTLPQFVFDRQAQNYPR